MPVANIHSLGIIGTGAWGTALAVAAKRCELDVRMWGRRADVADSLARGDGNPVYLPGIALPAVPASVDASILSDVDAILAVAPAQHMRDVLQEAAPDIPAGVPVLICAKGIEQSSLKMITDVLRETIPTAVPGVLSGPSFAHDVAKGLPTAVTLACADEPLGRALVTAIGQQSFRPYWTGDVVGAEVGGAVKNVLAIACGIVEGLALGKSAHAALLSRGFAEMRRLGIALGAEETTLSGLSGLGDLVLTCSSNQSRNMSFGIALGRGQTAAEILTGRGTVTEGVATAPALTKLAELHDVEMPICRAVDHILSGDITIKEAIQALLERPFKGEI
ncbi:MAG: NAD(P)H-dependent glycerol-3-phosphate dehydrogenase [Pseudomonadota bacterium]